MNQKGFISILAAVFITTLLVGGGVFYYQQQNTDQQIKELYTKASLEISQLKQEVKNLEAELVAQTDQKESDISDWQYYSDEKFGFSIEFPADWNYKNVSEENILHFRKEECSIESCGFTIAIVASGEDTLSEYLDKVYGTGEAESFVFYETSEIEINGLKATRGKITGPGAYKYDVTYFQHGAYIYQFKYALQDLKGNTVQFKNELRLIEQALFTFQFLDNTLDWQTYSDNNFGYSFQYPKNWNIDGQLLSYTNIEKYETGSTNAPIVFGVYSTDSSLVSSEKNILSFANKQYHINTDQRNTPDSVVTMGGRQFDKYDLIGYGQYEGLSAGNVVILVSKDNIFDNPSLKLVFTWEEKPAGKELSGNDKQKFFDIIETVSIYNDWQTYSNEEFKFSISIPKEIIVKEQENSRIVFTLTENKYFSIYINEKNLDPSELCYDGVCNAKKINIMNRDFYNLSYGDAGWGFNSYYTYINGYTFTFTFASSEAGNIWDYSEINNILASFNVL